MDENDPPERDPLPDVPALSVEQAVNWLASGRAIKGDLVAQELDRARSCIPVHMPGADGPIYPLSPYTVAALHDLSGEPGSAPVYPPVDWARSRKGEQRYRAIALALVSEYHRSPAEMCRFLVYLLQRVERVRRRQEDAVGQLVDAFKHEKLSVKGRWADAVDGPRSQISPIDAAEFRDADRGFDSYWRWCDRERPVLVGLQLRTDELAAVFGNPSTAPSIAKSPQARRSTKMVPPEKLDTELLEIVRGFEGERRKSAHRIRTELRQKTKCSRDAAQEAVERNRAEHGDRYISGRGKRLSR